MIRYHLLSTSILWALTLGLGCITDSASADIILDEFTDSAMVTNSLSNTYIETLDVGPLGARREIRIGSVGSDPYGTLDINITEPGQMAASIDRIETTASGTPVSAVQFNYYFDQPTDVTEGGVNDAILFDFVSLTGDIQPSWLRATLQENTRPSWSYAAYLSPLVPQDSYFTLVAPVEAFARRDGVPATPDFTTLRSISFDFYFLGHSGELDWEARLERIRFGPTDSIAVPEPGSGLIVVLALLVWRSFSSN